MPFADIASMAARAARLPKAVTDGMSTAVVETG
ncbi:hypothetical protein SAOR_13290 [Salinisphaera orenii MK-B5]|uniref:Uncharacterized protein n=1 Tax=Salinisphaera orenii MK-B5 TaxID=856730 RepID=A0A423PHH9_9GAMM|nr:hypothetical protein SAOR_13290 [Salinisphaera orenii MK-B5]